MIRWCRERFSAAIVDHGASRGPSRSRSVRTTVAITALAIAGVLLVPATVPDQCATAGTVETVDSFVLEPTEMRHEIGLAWYVALPPSWKEGADDVDHPQRSVAVLLEDGRPLGPAHAVHATIRKNGGGAFSHWLELVYFSTSDGSDPRTNGKEYVLQLAPRRAVGTRGGARSAAP